VIAVIAAREGFELSRGDGSCCSTPLGFDAPGDECRDPCCTPDAR
jgi:hypothetical protein